MTTGSEEVTSPAVVRGDDAYHLTPEGIKEPPEGWGPSLRYFGPGLILSASIVGSGELIATTTLGAQAGFAILWMVIFSTLVKVAVQVEFARWTISTGQPALTGYNKVPPKIGPLGWVNALWTLMALPQHLLSGGGRPPDHPGRPAGADRLQQGAAQNRAARLGQRPVDPDGPLQDPPDR